MYSVCWLLRISWEDKLDGTNYPLWAYMMGHVLVAKGLWNILKGNDTCPGSTNIGTVEDVAGSDSECNSSTTGFYHHLLLTRLDGMVEMRILMP